MPFSTNQAPPCGKFQVFTRPASDLLGTKLTHLYSIIMEFADNGDLFQKIVEHQKSNTFFDEDDVWRVFI